MEDFVFKPWELDQENDEMILVSKCGERKIDEFGETQFVRVDLTLGKGNNPSFLEIYDDLWAKGKAVEVKCDNLADLLNKMEDCFLDFLTW